MKEDERKKLGLVKELKYRYAFASGDFNFLQEKENTNYLRALARLGIRMDNGENDKYFTPESIMEIKKKKKDSNYNTTLINPIYISDFQAPLEDYEIITSGGGPLYDDQGNQIGNEPIVETKKVKRPAERRITPADVQLGLEGAGGTVNTTIPPEGTDNSIKKLKVAFATTWSPPIGSNQASAGVEIYTKPDGSFQKSQMGPDDDFNSSTSFTFDAFGYITVSGIKYSAIQVISPDESLTALQSLRNRKDPDLDRLIDAWGLSESEIPAPVTPEESEEREAPQAEEGEEQSTNATADEVANTTANSSLMEKISRLRGWKVSDDGQVQKDKKGNPIVVDKDPQISLGKSAEVTIDASGNVSIKGDVTINIPSKSDKVKLIENGKFAIPFGTIEGNFLCRKVGLTTLVGCPKVVKGTFDCSNNQITTLAGAPDEVGIFIANNNKSLASLTGGPKKINGITDTAKSQKEHIYDVSSCALTSLDGNGITSFGPGGFNCGNNKITSLSGLGVVTTTGVTRFDCSKNVLTSLVGAPKTVKDAKTGKPGNYDISGNKDITSFPTSMADIEVDDFKASGLSLSSLSFAPKQVYGNFDCSGNNGKKLTNQSIGKDRFKVASGFEEDAGNRIVKIDGDFITSEGSWNDKTYDINTVFKASKKTSSSGIIGGGSGKLPPLSLTANQTQIDAWMKQIFKDAGPGLHSVSSLSVTYDIAKFVSGKEGKEKWVYDDSPGPAGKYPQKWEDFSGNPTIGIGNLIISVKAAKANALTPTPAMIKWQPYFKPPAGNREYSLAEMHIEKVNDMLSFIRTVKGKFKNKDTKLTQSMFDALLSIAFNTGPNRDYCTCCNKKPLSGGPVGMIHQIEQGNYAEAARMLKTHSDCDSPKNRRGLVARRNDEYDWFIKNGYVT